VNRALSFVKVHWKETLALVLAAIPAAFVIFHKPTQQAASNLLTYIPATFGDASGGGGGDSSSGDTSSTSDPSSTTTTPAASTPVTIVKKVVAAVTGGSAGGGGSTRTSINGGTGTVVKPPTIKRRLPGTLGTGGGPNTTGRSSGTQIL
jgi:hypothetical protein